MIHMTNTDDQVTMEDYLDDAEEASETTETSTSEVSDDYDPNACDNCGRSFEHFGVRASKVLRRHERRCTGSDQDAT